MTSSPLSRADGGTPMLNIFASPAEPKRPRPLIVGAIKANIGHSEAAAGIVFLIKTILMLHCGTIPPQPNQPFSLNPYLVRILEPGIDVQLVNGQAWPKNGTNPDYVFVDDFDAAGGNMSVLIDEALSPMPSCRRRHGRMHDLTTSWSLLVALKRRRRRKTGSASICCSTQKRSWPAWPTRLPRGACITISETPA
ncbi:polyketide synthase pks13 [Imshaugia aleurites]|uniref:Polyketide synthase pks13 n=1 Tax=Imshaugia aleurites TaxID=172621 RepID=A0A8H3EPE8_9LECA|nr:polyketide synthase pks13 [Imshaugia aleurites]